ncbi:hypothetical protein [Streptomyces sp. 2-1]|uniref:hypothetical protein n=1 Tax=Streptomyces sp. 2-1 TaxID=412710 RepID=UPI003AFA8633|nr:hypothetical protein [Streptomyces phaeochromogenes]
MFRQLARHLPGGADYLFRLHPAELSALLEEAWNFRIHDTDKTVGHPDRRSDLPGLPDHLLKAFPGFSHNQTTFTTPARDGCPDGTVRWEHLIYAYMIENTRAADILRRVVQLHREGEELGAPGSGAEHWLRNTEELFFRDPAPFFITARTSQARTLPDIIRRKAYYRMFGMDLVHGTEDGAPVPYSKAAAANTQFVGMFEEFLREVWIAITNVNNTSGSDPTDTMKITDLVERLSDMLTTRRLGSNLSAEEYSAISTMAWFHLTLEYNSPIVNSLRAEASSAEQRLFKIAERVRIPAHAMSRSFFKISEAISRLLIAIEAGVFINSVESLFKDTSEDGKRISNDIKTVITHWSITTGRDLKAGKVTSK